MEELFRFDDEALARAAQAARASCLKAASTAQDIAQGVEVALGVATALQKQRDALAERFPMFAEEYDRLRAAVSLASSLATAKGIPPRSFRSFAYRSLRCQFGVRRSVYLPHAKAESILDWLDRHAVDAYLATHSPEVLARLGLFVEWLQVRGLKAATARDYRAMLARISARLLISPEALAQVPAKDLREFTLSERTAIKQFRKFLSWRRRHIGEAA